MMNYTERIIVYDDDSELVETKCEGELPVFSIRYEGFDVYETDCVEDATQLFMDEFAIM